jgi:DNA-binding transcriptional LysR family regulator
VLSSHDEVLGYLLPDVVEKFAAAHPLARLRLLARSVEETIRLVRMNETDLGVIPQRTLPKELAFHRLATYPAYLLTPKGHPLARRARADFMSLLSEETLRQYPLIVAEVQIEGYALEATFAQHGLPLNVGMEVGTINTLKQYVTRGLGVSVISGLCVTDADRSALEVVPIPTQLGGDSTYGVVIRSDKHRSRLLADLLMLLGVGAGKRGSTPQ